MRKSLAGATLSVIIATGGSPALAQQTTTAVSDGPYVFWEPDGARVVAVCDGERVERRVHVAESFALDVPCLDLPPVRIDAEPQVPRPAEYAAVPRILAIGDLHGEYEAACALLRASGVVDDELHWMFGTGHVVFNGDVFDRGDRVTESLWLIYRLEQEARQAGGRVHMVLGNHEVMVIRGDLRYVHEQYVQVVASEFGLAYDELFGADTELGRWLRAQNAVVKINGLVFVHGGISPDVAALGLSLEQINGEIRRGMDADASRVSSDETLGLFLGSRGPLWYRGYFMAQFSYVMAASGYEPATIEEVRTVLDQIGAKRLVVGHTAVEQVEGYYGGLVVGIHVPMEAGTPAEGLLWADGRLYRVDAAGRRDQLSIR
ncbi:MAG: metallophosphoesterase [Planctomycetota bacterium]